MSVPPTSKGVLESEDATDETARGQELADRAVGCTNSRKMQLFKVIKDKSMDPSMKVNRILQMK